MSNIVDKTTDKWLKKRIPAAAEFRFHHKNIFIFPSKFGGVFLFLCTLLFLLGTNYQNNLMLLLCYFLVAIFTVTLLTSYINFARLHIQQGRAPQVFVGDNLHFPLWINANKQHKLVTNGHLFFSFKTPRTKNKQDINTVTKIDINHFNNPVSINYKCQTRGLLQLPRVTMASYYPLGLFKCWTHLAFNGEMIVYPRPLPCAIELAPKALNTNKNQQEVLSQQAGHDEFSHLKAYQAGEPLHHVAWKQVAKGRGMVSKHFATNEQKVGWLSLPQVSSLEEIENEISKLTFQVIELAKTQQTFGLDLGNIQLAPGQGNAHSEACLKALALYTYGVQ